MDKGMDQNGEPHYYIWLNSSDKKEYTRHNITGPSYNELSIGKETCVLVPDNSTVILFIIAIAGFCVFIIIIVGMS